MTESKKKRTRRVTKPALKVNGVWGMPGAILPWEIDLLGPILAAVKDVGYRRIHFETGVEDDGR